MGNKTVTRRIGCYATNNKLFAYKFLQLRHFSTRSMVSSFFIQYLEPVNKIFCSERLSNPWTPDRAKTLW